MIEWLIATGILGGVFGLLATPWFSYFVEGLAAGKVRYFAISACISLLGGTTLLSLPVGAALDEVLLPWYIIGTGITFGPFAIVIVWRYTFGKSYVS